MKIPGVRTRGYLPHLIPERIPILVTYRMADSLPQTVLAGFEQELQNIPDDVAGQKRRQKIENYLDAGYGSCALRNPAIADIVEENLFWFAGKDYDLHAWVVMPNHVHALITPYKQDAYPGVVKRWKSYTAKKANHVLQRTGKFWQPEYHDRFMRNKNQFWTTVQYIEMNPVIAGLCAEPKDWRHSSASRAGHDYKFYECLVESLEGIF